MQVNTSTLQVGTFKRNRECGVARVHIKSLLKDTFDDPQKRIFGFEILKEGINLN